MNEEARLLFQKPLVEEGVDLNRAALDAFGKLLAQMVRDHAIIDMDSIIAGRAPPSIASRFSNLSSLTQEQHTLLMRLIAETVDTTLHHLLWTLEQVEWLDIVVHTEAGTVPDLNAVSDGLAG